MKALLLILALSQADWIAIKEMSGSINDHPGLTVKTSATQIARGGDIIKVLFRMEFPEGAPMDIFRDAMPRGFDVSSIVRVEGRLQLNCATLVVKPLGSTAEVYQFNGKKHKTKEPPFKVGSANIFAQYFCEQPSAPATEAPTLKPK